MISANRTDCECKIISDKYSYEKELLNYLSFCKEFLYSDNYEEFESAQIRKCFEYLGFPDDKLCEMELNINPYLKCIKTYKNYSARKQEYSNLDNGTNLNYLLPSKIATGDICIKSYCYTDTHSFEFDILNLTESFSICEFIDMIEVEGIRYSAIKEKILTLVRAYLSKQFIIPSAIYVLFPHISPA